MFEKLIESTTNEKENKKQSAYFGLTTIIYAALIGGIMVWSVFSFDLSDLNRNTDLTLETLVAPIPQIEPEIPQPRPISPPKTNAPKNALKNFDVLRNPVESIKNSTKPPDGITTNKVDVDEITKGVKYVIGAKTDRTSFINGGESRPEANAVAFESVQAKSKPDEIDAPPPIVKKPEIPPVEKKQPIMTKGVVNSIAVKLPKPLYPPPAKAVSASGAVNVQVTIDEQGSVISAVATSGHPLLRAAAVGAAKQAKFTPTKLSDQPVKVTGVIVYNFVP
jgi:TonB family protein